jgi:hypothetical protein
MLKAFGRQERSSNVVWTKLLRRFCLEGEEFMEVHPHRHVLRQKRLVMIAASLEILLNFEAESTRANDKRALRGPLAR